MAERRKKVPGSAPGTFYVDRECIDCDLCRETAPENFQRNEDEGFSYVYKQPETDEEVKLCEEALEGCPVEAIGSDGEEEEAAESESAAEGESPEALAGG